MIYYEHIGLSMANDHNPENRPIEDESSLIEQSVGVAIGMLDSVIAEIKDPTSTFLYDINCDTSTHLEALEEIMTHLEDAYEALETEEMDFDPHANNEWKQWLDSAFLVNLPSLNCGHAPTHAYMQTWVDGSRDMVAECHRCNYSAVVNEAYDNYNGNDMNTDTHTDFDDHEGERQAEAEAERQADAQAEMNAEACYDDLEGGWY